ncbi:MAG: hypothetical protein KatS3mg111_1040 [Pirellulaceae bacterium]|nr:MAG: hypothetical protein KatS3mg111_1040 [Pirellulaceae bacterium]
MGGNSTTTTLGGWLMAGAVVVGWAFGTFDRALRQVETAAIAQEPSQAGEPSRESSFAGTLKSQVGADSDRAATDHLLPPGPDRGEFPHLHNLLRVSRLIYCGGEPTGEAAFADLARLGIKTVVSVDGARPNLELAKKYGLRYVHIPIGYDGISEAAGLALASLVRHADGPYYIHCHHGQHRGPAAAAVACVAAGVASGAEAVAILEQAGTSKSYHGLWRDVVHYASPAVGGTVAEVSRNSSSRLDHGGHGEHRPCHGSSETMSTSRLDASQGSSRYPSPKRSFIGEGGVSGDQATPSWRPAVRRQISSMERRGGTYGCRAGICPCRPRASGGQPGVWRPSDSMRSLSSGLPGLVAITVDSFPHSAWSPDSDLRSSK